MIDPKPACWRWRPPADFGAVLLIEERRESAERGGKGFMYGPNLEFHAQWALLRRWHRCRCAVCGDSFRDTSGLVRDHDHSTGLIRGLLCYPCNTDEGLNAPGEFDKYRERPPAAICGVRLAYGRLAPVAS